VRTLRIAAQSIPFFCGVRTLFAIWRRSRKRISEGVSQPDDNEGASRRSKKDMIPRTTVARPSMMKIYAALVDTLLDIYS
jgi:hypothetical protein